MKFGRLSNEKKLRSQKRIPSFESRKKLNMISKNIKKINGSWVSRFKTFNIN